MSWGHLEEAECRLVLEKEEIRILEWRRKGCSGLGKPQRQSLFLKVRRASLMVQWLGIHLPARTQFWSLVQEYPTYHGTTNPGATTTEAWEPRAYALQQEKPSQWETHAPQLKSSPNSPLEKTHTAMKTQHDREKKERKNYCQCFKVAMVTYMPINPVW